MPRTPYGRSFYIRWAECEDMDDVVLFYTTEAKARFKALTAETPGKVLRRGSQPSEDDNEGGVWVYWWIE